MSSSLSARRGIPPWPAGEEEGPSASRLCTCCGKSTRGMHGGGDGAASPSERVKLCVVDHICLALAEHGRLSRADLIRCVSEGGCDSENVGRYLGQKRREKRGMFDLDDENFVLTKEGAQLAVNLGVEPTYVQGRRGGP